MAFCVKTFDRPACATRLVESILDQYPDAAIYVADDGREPVSVPRATAIRLPFDSGISSGRNRLVRETREPFLLFHDDDFVYGDSTRIEILLEFLLQHPEFGLVAGAVEIPPGRRWSFEGWLHLHDGVLEHRPDTSPVSDEVPPWKEVGTCMNFLLARRRVFEAVRWDEELKVAEHVPFLVDLARASCRAAFTPAVVVEHHVHYAPDYARYRLRAPIYEALGLAKRGIREFVDYWGKRTSIPSVVEARRAVHLMEEELRLARP
ncbi:MAG: glycosyltransferase [Planctomycetes bacterium]|nr:glycosyltransferase [Planctomycetota bacterium]